MTDLVDSPLEPITYSADGKRNSYTLTCAPRGQSMNYAACIWRQNVLSNPTVITPADWSSCKDARERGKCIALEMRHEEELAGKSIYFRAREAIRSVANKWLTPSTTTRSTGTVHESEPSRTTPRPAPVSRPKTMLDAMGSAGDLSDALGAAAIAPASPPAEARVHIPIIPIMPIASTGESPLQMARRIASERSAAAGGIQK